jgi:hypothetical protein
MAQASEVTLNDRKGLNPQQAEFAMKIYKHIGTIAEVLKAIHLQEEHKKALINL